MRLRPNGGGWVEIPGATWWEERLGSRDWSGASAEQRSPFLGSRLRGISAVPDAEGDTGVTLYSYNIGQRENWMKKPLGQDGSILIELLNMKTLSCSDEAYALVHELAAEKGISYSDALDQLMLNRPQESQADPEELAKTKAELQEARDQVKLLETRLSRRAFKKGSGGPKMNEEDWAQLAKIGQRDSGVFMREVRDRGLLPFD
jgi:predicted CopG family antitoxin